MRHKYALQRKTAGLGVSQINSEAKINVPPSFWSQNKGNHTF